jgi:Transposase DDE domain
VTWGADPAQPIAARFCALRVRPVEGRGDRWLLCERSPTEVHKYYLLHLPPTATLQELVTLARSRWPIEQQYRELKEDLGLDHFEGRSYRGWTHHVVLTAVAFTFLRTHRGRRCPSCAVGSARSLVCSTSSTTDDYSACLTAFAATPRSEGDKVVLG